MCLRDLRRRARTIPLNLLLWVPSSSSRSRAQPHRQHLLLGLSLKKLGYDSHKLVVPAVRLLWSGYLNAQPVFGPIPKYPHCQPTRRTLLLHLMWLRNENGSRLPLPLWNELLKRPPCQPPAEQRPIASHDCELHEQRASNGYLCEHSSQRAC